MFVYLRAVASLYNISSSTSLAMGIVWFLLYNAVSVDSVAYAKHCIVTGVE